MMLAQVMVLRCFVFEMITYEVKPDFSWGRFHEISALL
jgi:hypothetical protein